MFWSQRFVSVQMTLMTIFLNKEMNMELSGASGIFLGQEIGD